MMSEFKFCPMCGAQREDSEQFCHSCSFEYLSGRYVKADEFETLKKSDVKANADDNLKKSDIESSEDDNLKKSDIESSEDDNLKKSDVKANDNLKKSDIIMVSQEEFIKANDLIKGKVDKINESIDICLNKILFDLENDSDLKNLNSDFDTSIFDYENLNIQIIDRNFEDLEFSNLIDDIDYDNDDFLNAQETFINWIVSNRSHLPGFIIHNYKAPSQATADKLTLIIKSLEGLRCYDGLDRFRDVLNGYLRNQENFLINF